MRDNNTRHKTFFARPIETTMSSPAKEARDAELRLQRAEQRAEAAREAREALFPRSNGSSTTATRLFGTNVAGSGSADRGLEVPSQPCGHGGGFGTAAAPQPVSVGTVRRRALPTPPLKSVCAVATQGLAARGGVTGWVGHHVSQTDLPPLPRPETPHHSGRSDLCAVATLLACRQVVGASDIGGRRGVGARALSAPARSADAQASRACLLTWGRA